MFSKSNVFNDEEKNIILSRIKSPVRENRVNNLMLCDEVVLTYDSKRVIRIVKEDLLPFSLQSKGELLPIDIEVWLISRGIDLNRENAKEFMGSIGVDPQDILKAVKFSNGLSLSDCYWIKDFADGRDWAEMNLYENKFSSVLERVLLTGNTSMTIQGELKTPELSTGGVFAKCWRREDNSLFLYKTSKVSMKESEAEFICSEILDVLGIKHVKYELIRLYNRVMTRCEIMTSTSRMLIPFVEFYKFYDEDSESALDFVKMEFMREFFGMTLFDGIVNNTDRHRYNWGFLVDTSTNSIKSMAPLFDHNKALDFTQQGNSRYFEGKTLLEAARDAYRILDCGDALDRLENWLNEKEDMLYTLLGTDSIKGKLIDNINFIRS